MLVGGEQRIRAFLPRDYWEVHARFGAQAGEYAGRWFDENFVGWGPEDWEFNHRLCTKHGYTPIYLDDITAYHLETPDAVGNVFRVGTHEEIVMYMSRPTSGRSCRVRRQVLTTSKTLSRELGNGSQNTGVNKNGAPNRSC